MTIRRIGIPAVPPGLEPELHQFFTAMRQELLRLDAAVQVSNAEVANALIHGAESVHDIGNIPAGSVLTPNPNRGFLQRCTNVGAFTLTIPPVDCFIYLSVIEGVGAGAIDDAAYDQETGAWVSHGTGSQYFARIVRILDATQIEWTRVK
jgi:hypothetical protein